MEVGWHLRFSREGKLTVLADEAARGQLENQLFILPEWRMETTLEDGHLRAEFTRPRYPGDVPDGDAPDGDGTGGNGTEGPGDEPSETPETSGAA